MAIDKEYGIDIRATFERFGYQTFIDNYNKDRELLLQAIKEHNGDEAKKHGKTLTPPHTQKEYKEILSKVKQYYFDTIKTKEELKEQAKLLLDNEDINIFTLKSYAQLNGFGEHKSAEELLADSKLVTSFLVAHIQWQIDNAVYHRYNVYELFADMIKDASVRLSGTSCDEETLIAVLDRHRTYRKEEVDNTTLTLMLGEYLHLPSIKEMANAFTTTPNDFAYITSYKKSQSKLGLNREIITPGGEENEIEARTNSILLAEVFSILIECYDLVEKTGDFNFRIYTPSFFKATGQRFEQTSSIELYQNFLTLDDKIGMVRNRPYSVLSCSLAGDYLRLSSDYLIEIFKELEKNKKLYFAKFKEVNEPIPKLRPATNSLVKSTIISERNKTAIEVVFALTNAFLQRGATKKQDDGYFYYDIALATLIKKCPQLKESLASIKDKQHRERKVKTTLIKAIKLLRTQTDTYHYFEDFKISIPQNIKEKNFSETITACWTKRNKNYNK